MGQKSCLQLSSEPTARHSSPGLVHPAAVNPPDRTNANQLTAVGVTYRPHFAVTQTRRDCIDRREFGRSPTRTLPSISGRFWTKCAASRRTCRGVATAIRKATPLPAGGLSNRRDLTGRQSHSGVFDLSNFEGSFTPHLLEIRDRDSWRFVMSAQSRLRLDTHVGVTSEVLECANTFSGGGNLP